MRVLGELGCGILRSSKKKKVLQMGSMPSERELLLQRVFLVVEGAASTTCVLLEGDRRNVPRQGFKKEEVLQWGSTLS